MQIQQFSKSEAIKFGWEKMKANFWTLVGILIVAWVISGILSAIAVLAKGAPALYSLLEIVSVVVGIIVGMGLIKIALKFCDNEKVDVGDLFSMYNKFINYLIGAILYGLIVLGGLILLIVPGIIWAIKYQFYGYLIIDKNMGPLEAIKRSGQMTQGHKGNLFLLGLLVGLINIAGVIALGVGLFATIPTGMIAMAYVYRKLSGDSAVVVAPEPVEKVPVAPPSDVISEAPRV